MTARDVLTQTVLALTAVMLLAAVGMFAPDKWHDALFAFIFVAAMVGVAVGTADVPEGRAELDGRPYPYSEQFGEHGR